MINTIVVGLSLWLFQIVDQTTSLYVIAGLTFLFGLCISLQYSGMNSLAYADITADDLSAATSIVSTVQQLAQSMGVAGAALFLRYYSRGSTPDVQLTPQVFHQTFFAMGVLTCLSVVIFLRLKPSDGHQMLKAPVQGGL